MQQGQGSSGTALSCPLPGKTEQEEQEEQK